MGYRTLFVVTVIHHSNTRLQITHDMHINDFFVLLFDFAPERGAGERHTSHPENGSMRIEFK